MNREEITRLAKEADLWLTSDERIAAVERFAALVAAAELEACCDLLEGMHAAAATRHNYYKHAAQSLRQLRGKE